VSRIRKIDYYQACVNDEPNGALGGRVPDILLFSSSEIQLTHAPRAARCFWTSAVQLNLMENVADILGIISQEMTIQSSSYSQTHFSLEFIQKYSAIKLQLHFLDTTRTQLSRQLSGTVGISDDSDMNPPDRRMNEEIGTILAGFVKVVKMLWDDETVQKTLGVSLKWQEAALSSSGLYVLIPLFCPSR